MISSSHEVSFTDNRWYEVSSLFTSFMLFRLCAALSFIVGISQYFPQSLLSCIYVFSVSCLFLIDSISAVLLLRFGHGWAAEKRVRRWWKLKSHRIHQLSVLNEKLFNIDFHLISSTQYSILLCAVLCCPISSLRMTRHVPLFWIEIKRKNIFRYLISFGISAAAWWLVTSAMTLPTMGRRRDGKE